MLLLPPDSAGGHLAATAEFAKKRELRSPHGGILGHVTIVSLRRGMIFLEDNA